MNTWHPYLVHFPIALFVAAFLLHGLQLWRPKWFSRTIGLWLLGLGALTGFWTSLTGDKAAALAQQQPLVPKAVALLNQHTQWATLTSWGGLALFILWLYFFLKDRENRRVDVVALALLGLLAVGVMITSYLGSQLVFTQGVGLP
jgi:uncharacterized membrane protein